MSIVASVKVFDGVALGADSMTQIWGSVGSTMGIIKTYQNAKKIFQISNLPIGVMTYGVGNIGKRSMESLINEFQKDNQLNKESIQKVTEKLHLFLLEKYKKEFPTLADSSPTLGIFVAGYSSTEKHLAGEYEFVLPQDKETVRAVKPLEQFGASWRGISEPISRLLMGFDPHIVELLRANAIPEESITQIANLLPKLFLQIAFDGMPLQDAIEFLKFILQTTIWTTTFMIGTPSCGLPIDVAIITPNGFQWIEQKGYSLKNGE